MTRIVLCLLFFFSSLSLHVLGSSHSEAPGTAKIPSADAVDFYMFRSYEDDREDYTTFILNAYPLQDPFAGPNYFALSDQHFYQFHIDNDGDAVSDIDISFYFGAQLGGEEYQTPFDPEFCDCNSGTVPDETKHHGLTVDILDADGVSINHPQFVPLKFIGPVSGPDDATLNFKETFQIRWTQGGVDTEIENPSGGFSFPKPFDYAGEKTFGDAETYESYARSFIQSFSIPNCAEQGKVFVGQRKEPFHINLGKIFDLVNFIPIQDFIEQSDNNNDLRFISTTSLVIELPTSCVLGASDVIGAWTTVNQLCHAGADHVVGEQFSRLGNPLVNELVIGLEKKKDFNQQPPTDDAASFLDFVQFPSFPAILDLLFRDAVNDAMGTDISNLAPNNLPRNDLVTVFLTGIAGLNMPPDPNFMASEMMRLNTTVPPTKRQNQEHLGLIGGDSAGFPNGRRPGDDVVDIVLRVAMGVLCYLTDLCEEGNAPVGNVLFTDGAPLTASDFDDEFPYLRTPVPGSPFPGSGTPSPSPSSSSANLLSVSTSLFLVAPLLAILNLFWF